jgi:hypothetical protein
VLLRYVAGHAPLGDFLMEEADALPRHRDASRHLRRAHAALLERLTISIAAEYQQEEERIERSPERRVAERVQRLLAGAPADAVAGYELDAWHLGVIATGAQPRRAARAVESLATKLGRERLLVPRDEHTVWAWLGARRRFSIADAGRLLVAKGPGEVSLTVGEPGRGIHGFRVTHSQAQAAQLVALRRPRALTRFRDVALLAMALRDEALARSLVELHLSPLDNPRRSSAVLRQTLRAYFLAERNAPSAAQQLGVARHTVENRLRKVEQRLNCPLHTCMAELEVALQLEELGAGPGSEDSAGRA